MMSVPHFVLDPSGPPPSSCPYPCGWLFSAWPTSTGMGGPLHRNTQMHLDLNHLCNERVHQQRQRRPGGKRVRCLNIVIFMRGSPELPGTKSLVGMFF
jgi:hypothetical protein